MQTAQPSRLKIGLKFFFFVAVTPILAGVAIVILSMAAKAIGLI